MEDQQSYPGDLIDVAPDEESAEAATGSADLADDTHRADGGTGWSDEGTAEDSAADADTTGPANRRAGRVVGVAAGLSAALFVGAGGFAGAAAQPYLMDRALVATKLEVVRTATAAIATLWNYTPENMSTLAERASIYLSGDLEADYRKFIDVIAETNKQARVTDSTEITGAAVESLAGRDAVVLVYTNTTATSELTKTIPSLKYLSHRLLMRRDHNRWVITKMPTITSLDLTPRR